MEPQGAAIAHAAADGLEAAPSSSVAAADLNSTADTTGQKQIKQQENSTGTSWYRCRSHCWMLHRSVHVAVQVRDWRRLAPGHV
jgi:hypothetical protein